MKKVVIVSLRGPTNHTVKGGAREYCYHFAKILSKNGFFVEILCAPEKRKNLFDSEIVQGLKVKRIKNKNLKVYGIIRNLKHFKGDGIFIENIVSFPMLLPLFKKVDIAIVHHLPGKTLFKTHGLSKAITGLILEFVLLRIIYRKVKFIAVSEFTKMQLINRGISKEKVVIINPGIDHIELKMPEKSKNPTILFIGRYDKFNTNKNLDHVVKIYKYLKKDFDSLQLLIGGRVDAFGALLNEIKDDKDIVEYGFLEDFKKTELYKKSWVFVSPSKIEGFGMTWIEANSYYTPAFAYDIKNLFTIDNGINGYKVEMNDWLSLAEVLKIIFINETYRERLAVSSYKYSKKYSWDKFNDKIICYFNKE